MFRFVSFNEIRGTKLNEAIDIRPQRKGPTRGWAERGRMAVAEKGQDPNSPSTIFGHLLNICILIAFDDGVAFDQLLDPGG